MAVTMTFLFNKIQIQIKANVVKKQKKPHKVGNIFAHFLKPEIKKV